MRARDLTGAGTRDPRPARLIRVRPGRRLDRRARGQAEVQDRIHRLVFCAGDALGCIGGLKVLHERFGLLSTYGGRTNFPIICDDLVIVSAVVIGWGEMAKPAHRFIGLNKRTGEVVWFNGTRPLPYDTTYSGPTISVINNQKTLVFGSGDGAVWGFQPRTGKQIFQNIQSDFLNRVHFSVLYAFSLQNVENSWFTHNNK